jgi:hypothetical protein
VIEIDSGLVFLVEFLLHGGELTSLELGDIGFHRSAARMSAPNITFKTRSPNAFGMILRASARDF